MRLDAQVALRHPNDPPGLGKNQLDHARVLAVLARDLLGERRGRHLAEVCDTTFRLRDDFLADDEHVVVTELEPLAGESRRDQRGQVVAGADGGDAFDGEDLE